MRRFLWILLICFILVSVSSISTHAQDIPPQVTKTELSYLFNKQINVSAHIQSNTPIENVRVFFKAEGDSNVQTGQAMLGTGTDLLYIHDLTGQYFRPFSTIFYWFEITTAGGQMTTSPSFTFTYIDNRFEWQSLESDNFQIHWYQGDDSAAQKVLQAAQDGIAHFKNFLPVQSGAPIEIYIYATIVDLQSTMQGINRNLIAGHADPDLHTILLTLSSGPSQTLEIQQRVPHELAHILLYRYAGKVGYAQLPTWFNEGLASINELSPNPDYFVATQTAFQDERLLTISTLCQGFPNDASGAFLAYAESASFMQYIAENFGSQGLKTIIQAYQNGAECENGTKTATGLPLSSLERDWRQATFQENIVVSSLRNLSPWFFLMFIILFAPFTISVFFIQKNKDRQHV